MKIRKITALLLTAVLVLGLFAGCEKPMDAETLAQKMSEASANITAASGKMELELDLTMSVTGMSMDLGMDMEAEFSTSTEPVAMFMDLTMDMEVLGQSESADMQMYAAEEDGMIVAYAYDGSTDTWARTETAVEDYTSMNVTSNYDLTDISAEDMNLAEEKQTIDGREVYVLTVNFTVEKMNEMMEQYMDTATAELDVLSKEMLESMDFSAVTVAATYYVDCETYLPLRTEMDMQGLDSVLNDLMATAMEDALAGADEGYDLELTFTIETCELAMYDMVYTDVQVPTVPQEGVEAAAMNPDQGDGSYVLRLDGAAVRIVCPEGYTSYYVDSEYLGIATDDYLTTVDYWMYAGYTEEDVIAEVEDYAGYMQEAELYESHGAMDSIGDFTVMYVQCNDGSTNYFAWKWLGETLLKVNIYTESTPDLAAVLECVEDYQG